MERPTARAPGLEAAPVPFNNAPTARPTHEHPDSFGLDGAAVVSEDAPGDIPGLPGVSLAPAIEAPAAVGQEMEVS